MSLGKVGPVGSAMFVGFVSSVSFVGFFGSVKCALQGLSGM